MNEMIPIKNDKFEKKIKKNIYGKPQSLIITFPAGLGAIALDEIYAILNDLWFKQDNNSQCSLLKNTIRIDKIHLFAAVELLMRSQCLTDIRLILWEGKAFGKSGFIKKCTDISWDMYLNQNMSLKIRVNSIASKAFHESGLKEILSGIVKDSVAEVVSGEDSQETTTLYADLYKERLTVSLSLAGMPLYKRGYRGVLSESAPLREDAAACCIAKSLKFAKDCNKHFTPNTVLIPFSGTGTFLFEFLIARYVFSPVLFERNYALQFMPFFREKNFNYLKKKAQEHCLLQDQKDEIQFYCIDNSSSARDALLNNIKFFEETVKKNGFQLPNQLVINDDFFKLDVAKLFADQNSEMGNLFMPLNPPYGIRLGKDADSVAFYANIAKKINAISLHTQNSGKSVAGFILCPNEETWSAFCKSITHAKLDTYHFTQGGIDVRVCQFIGDLSGSDTKYRLELVYN